MVRGAVCGEWCCVWLYYVAMCGEGCVVRVAVCGEWCCVWLYYVAMCGEGCCVW